MNVDVILQRNSVYIGMEDVSVTYIDAERLENITTKEAAEYVKEKAKSFIESGQYKAVYGYAALGGKIYYPTQWDKPCRAIVCEAGKLNNIIRNRSDFTNAEIYCGAKEYRFTEAPKDSEEVGMTGPELLGLAVEVDFNDKLTFAKIAGYRNDYYFLSRLYHDGKITAAHEYDLEVTVPLDDKEEAIIVIPWDYDEDDKRCVANCGCGPKVKWRGTTYEDVSFTAPSFKINEAVKKMMDEYDFDHDESLQKEIEENKKAVEAFMEEENE